MTPPFRGIRASTKPGAVHNATQGTTLAASGQRGFLNASSDATNNLTNLGARQYDPALGRFTSVDPVLETSSPQQLNGYSYAVNDPIDEADPNGLAPACIGQGVCSGQSDSSGAWTITDVGTRQQGDPGPVPGPAPYTAGSLGLSGGTCAPNCDTSLPSGNWELVPGSRLSGSNPQPKYSAPAGFHCEHLDSLCNFFGIDDAADCGRHLGFTTSCISTALALLPVAGKAAKTAMDVGRGLRDIRDASVAADTAGTTAGKAMSQLDRTGSGLKSDVLHRSASWVVDDSGAQQFTIRGGDGVSRQLYQLPGEVNGKPGVFEWMVDDSGTDPVITHQRFINGGSVTGYPNQRP